MTPFQRADRLASRAVDRVNGRAFTLTPMVFRPNARPIRDMARETIEGVAILTDQSAATPIAIGNRRAGSDSNDLRLQAQGRAVSLSVDRHTHPNLAARQGDVVTVGERTFTVSSVRPDGLARVILHLEETQP